MTIETKAAKNGATASKTGPAASSLPEGFQEIKLERNVYKADSCRDYPVMGWLLAIESLPGGDGMAPWKALVIKLTSPTKVVNRDGDIVDAQTGDQILVPATAKVLQAFSRAASHTALMFQVWLQPTHKEPLGGGRSMWVYKFAVHKETMPRTGYYALPSSDVKALPAPIESAVSPPSATEQEIPF